MVSLKDISLKCGVSVATVSKALNDQSDISEETKKMVKRIADEMGYFPNASARALRTRRTNCIGVLFVDEAGSGLTHDFFAHVLDAFKVTTEAGGYDMLFINKNNRIGSRPISYLEHCRYRGVDGVVMACIDFRDKEVTRLLESEIPVVTIDHVFDNHMAVISDNVRGMRDLVQFVYDMGHRRMAYIHGADSSVTKSRLCSFYRTLEDLKVQIPDSYIREGNYRDTVTAARLTKELLELEIPPTCIFYPDDFAAIGGIGMIRSMGLSIPEDISVVGYDGTGLAGVMMPELTTLEQDTGKIGELAAKALINLVEHPKTTLIQSIVVEGRVSPGGSVKRLRQS
ncbi:MAG: LacI family DNA-binding transcriptional regulator [Eubacteriales bacterium]|nr:LacI family DNA-binding transcriptional regulator [Eubacteriales bacterium]